MKVFRLPKTLFIQGFVFIHPGVYFYCTANSEPGQIKKNTWMNKKKLLDE